MIPIIWDYAWWRPSSAQLKSNNVTAVCRYLSYDNTGKNLTKAEATFLKGLGIDIVSNWEYATDAALGGYNQGVKDAKEAKKQHTACGGPANAPIYFSCDWDATPGQQAAINSYLDGCASVIGRNRVGVYGSYYVVKRSMEAGKATWGWCTYAWSGGQVYNGAHIYQYNNGVMGGQADQNKALKSNFGQWSKNGAASMAVTGSDAKTLFNTDGVIAAPDSWRAANPTNKNTTWAAASFLRLGYDHGIKQEGMISDVKTSTANIENKVDDLANEVASLKAMLSEFKAPTVTIDPEAVKAALDGALKGIQYEVSPKAGA